MTALEQLILCGSVHSLLFAICHSFGLLRTCSIVFSLLQVSSVRGIPIGSSSTHKKGKGKRTSTKPYLGINSETKRRLSCMGVIDDFLDEPYLSCFVNGATKRLRLPNQYFIIERECLENTVISHQERRFEVFGVRHFEGK